MATPAAGRGRLYDTETTLGMILDSGAESEDDVGEPMCPGSDEEFPDSDYDDNRYINTIIHSLIKYTKLS